MCEWYNDVNTLIRLSRYVKMNSNNVRYTAIVATITFFLLTCLYYTKEFGEGGQYIRLVPPPVTFNRKKTTASQNHSSKVRQWLQKPAEISFNQTEKYGGSTQTKFSLSEQSKSDAADRIVYYKANESLADTESAAQSNHGSTCVKQIQFWGKINLKLAGGEYDCPAENCKARFVQSQSYEKFQTSHIVILHHKGSWTWEELERYRPAGQMWIYMTKESPLHSRKFKSPDPERLTFNWTLTYRSDSDFVIPYGRYTEDIPEVPADDNRNWATGKTRLIAWMASNCGVTSWGRIKFVNSLKKLIEVDTYGACGTLKCPRNEKCDEILSSHKFYLALENSQCEDYITEKFWRNAFGHHLVPIVYGTTREDYEKVAPPHSFIHLSDFSNMTSLVDYIKYLDKNDTAYNEYFQWKKKGSTEWFREVEGPMKSILCDMIRRLKELDNLEQVRARRNNMMVNINSWKSSACNSRQSIWSPKL